MTIEPVVKEVVVPAGKEAAFRRFTSELDLWWPRRSHSVFQDACSAVRMEGGEGGRLYEISDGGEEMEWGELTAWEPPEKVAFTWHPGRGPETAQQVEVTFREVEGGTCVRVEHSGWEALGGEGAAARDDYDTGWESVLAEYGRGLPAAS